VTFDDDDYDDDDVDDDNNNDVYLMNTLCKLRKIEINYKRRVL
jgi:hypothetical protein